MWSSSFLKTVFFTFCRNQPSEDKEACVVCPGRKQEPACILQEWGRCPHWEIPPREPQSDWCSHLIGPGQQQPVYHSVSWGCLICLILLRSSFINIIRFLILCKSFNMFKFCDSGVLFQIVFLKWLSSNLF